MAKPTDDSEVFIDALIRQIQQHLTTVGGIYITTGFIAPAPLPIPGFKTWTGYTIPPPQTNPPTPLTIPTETEQESFVEVQTEVINTDIQVAQEILTNPTSSSSTKSVAQIVISSSNEKKSVVSEIAKEPLNGETPDKDFELKPDNKYSKNENLDLIEKAMIKIGITDKAIIRATKANVIKESGGKPLAENLNYGGTSNDRIRSIFGARAKKYSDAQLNEIKKDKVKMGELMYGKDALPVGKWLGSTETGDGYKFRGRGFIQITGKANYSNCSLALYKNDSLIKNPELLEQSESAADSVAWFINRNLNSFSKKMGIPKNGPSQFDANLLITSIIAGSPIKRGGDGYLASLVIKVDGYAAKIA
jgi:predicted chitinase